MKHPLWHPDTFIKDDSTHTNILRWLCFTVKRNAHILAGWQRCLMQCDLILSLLRARNVYVCERENERERERERDNEPTPLHILCMAHITFFISVCVCVWCVCLFIRLQSVCKCVFLLHPAHSNCIHSEALQLARPQKNPIITTSPTWCPPFGSAMAGRLFPSAQGAVSKPASTNSVHSTAFFIFCTSGCQ